MKGAGLNLYQKILAVMKDVEYIEKKGTNDFHRYNYAREADVVAAVRASCVEHGLIILPKADPAQWELREFTGGKGDTNFILHVLIEFDIIDTETGEKHTISAWGSGTDKGDKGAYKAFTGAQKYALMKAFQIPTGDDPESFTEVDQNSGSAARSAPTSSNGSTATATASLACESCGKEVRASQRYTAEQRAGFIRRANGGRLICQACGGG